MVQARKFLGRKSHLMLFVLLVLSLTLSACSPGGVVGAFSDPTDTPTSIPPTDTPQPTSTYTPTPTETPVPTATATPDRRATISAQKTATAEAQAAMIEPELVEVGVNPEEGHLAWVAEDSTPMMVDWHWGESNYTLDDLGVVGDFVLQLNITWDSSSGLAGCAVNFRAEEDMKDGAHLAFQMMRLQYAPAWDIEYHKFNQWQSTLTGNTVFSSHINDDKMSTNQVTLIAKGGEFRTYINGEKEKVVYSEKLKEGLISFQTWQESGETTCIFSDAWVWVFDK